MPSPEPAEISALLTPYTVGGEVASGWRIVRARVDEQGRARVTVAGPSADVVLSERSDAPCFVQTRHFNVHLQPRPPADRMASSELQQVLQRVAQAVMRNDHERTVPRATGSPQVTKRDDKVAADSVLWLVPGHLGDPEDLSLRALRVLRLVARVLIEPGKAALARKLLATVGVERPAEVFVELGDDPLAAEKLIADAGLAGNDLALFGVDEGTPGLADPGRAVVMAATDAPGWQIRSLGGASALGTALMRASQPIGNFTFLTISDHQHERIRQWAAQPQDPLLCYTTPRQLRPLAHGWQGLPALSVTLLARLTQPDEQVVQAQLDTDGWHHLDLADDVPTVAILRPQSEQAASVRRPAGV